MSDHPSPVRVNWGPETIKYVAACVSAYTGVVVTDEEMSIREELGLILGINPDEEWVRVLLGSRMDEDSSMLDVECGIDDLADWISEKGASVLEYLVNNSTGFDRGVMAEEMSQVSRYLDIHNGVNDET